MWLEELKDKQMTCPKCGASGVCSSFKITCQISAYVQGNNWDEEYVDLVDPHVTDEDKCLCIVCNYEGTLKEFCNA